ncbi:MAG: sulfatase-like hydrolase/transferase [Proteobacteria bacterium]|nr:sulfatase-like hydrolase/transferase [Pseudomonadota bacterium]
MNKSVQKMFLFWPLVLLTAFLMALQIMHWQVLASLIPSNELPVIPTPIIKDFARYIAAQLFLWAFVVFAIWGTTRLTARLFKLDHNQTFYLGMITWFLSVLVIFLTNQYYFPRSIFAELMSALINPTFNKILLLSCVTLLSLELLLALLSAFLFLNKKFRFVMAVIFISGLSYFLFSSEFKNTVSDTKPNIIIIGFDSLRPDQLNHYGNRQNLAPHIDQFLKDSTHFTQAISPLARTYAAWTSILTGKYPKNNGARDNLLNPKELHLGDTLPQQLQKAGYETVYITDEKRFSNIDEQFGFDKILGPKIGFNDFFLGILYDFPLSNLIINTRLGAWLFPYNHANRAAHITYQPNTFNTLIKNFLREKHNKPLFLNIHFCITHWPYATASTSDEGFPPESVEKSFQFYQQSIQVVDKQFETLLNELKKNGLLKNSLVILLSDHGESFARAEDNLTSNPYVADPKKIPGPFQLYNQEQKKKSESLLERNVSTLAGHGSDVLSPSQSRVLLSFKSFGAFKNIPRNLPFTVSLVDLKPTILDFLNLSLGKNDGISLKPYIFNNTIPLSKPRPIFNETGFMPNSSIMLHASLPALVRIGVDEYELNSTNGRVQFKESKLSHLIANKQRAVIYKDWMLAFYPGKQKPIPVLVNLKTKEWTDVLTSPLAKQSPLPELLNNIKTFYGDELSL